jgi:hypothetical protein
MCARKTAKTDALYCSAHAQRYTDAPQQESGVAQQKSAVVDAQARTESSLGDICYKKLTREQNEALLLARLREVQCAIEPLVCRALQNPPQTSATAMRCERSIW